MKRRERCAFKKGKQHLQCIVLHRTHQKANRRVSSNGPHAKWGATGEGKPEREGEPLKKWRTESQGKGVKKRALRGERRELTVAGSAIQVMKAWVQRPRASVSVEGREDWQSGTLN